MSIDRGNIIDELTEKVDSLALQIQNISQQIAENKEIFLKIEGNLSELFYIQSKPTNEFKLIVETAYRDGYEYHQKAVHTDPELLKWILKEDYFE